LAEKRRLRMPVSSFVFQQWPVSSSETSSEVNDE